MSTKKRKIEIIKKEIKSSCWKCEGRGYIQDICCKSLNEAILNHCACKGQPIIGQDCDICNGTGIWIETFYYHCVDGICISGDTLK